MSLFDQDRVLGFQNDGSLDIYANSLRTNNQQGVAKFSSTGNIISVEKLSADDVDIDIAGVESRVDDVENTLTGMSFDGVGITTIDQNVNIGTESNFYKNITCNTVYCTQVQGNEFYYGDGGDDKRVGNNITALQNKTQKISYDSITGKTKLDDPLLIFDPFKLEEVELQAQYLQFGSGVGASKFSNQDHGASPSWVSLDTGVNLDRSLFLHGRSGNGYIRIGSNTNTAAGNYGGKLTVFGDAEIKANARSGQSGNLLVEGNLELGSIVDVEQEINDIKAQTPDLEGVTMLNVKTAGLNADKIVYEDAYIRLRWKNDATQYQIQVKTPGELTPGNKSPLYFRHGNNINVLAGANVDTSKWYFWSATETKDGSHDVGMTTFRNMGLYSSLDVSTPFPSYIFELLHIATSVNLVITKLSTPYS